jgi:hypothetical protein
MISMTHWLIIWSLGRLFLLACFFADRFPQTLILFLSGYLLRLFLPPVKGNLHDSFASSQRPLLNFLALNEFLNESEVGAINCCLSEKQPVACLYKMRTITIAFIWTKFEKFNPRIIECSSTPNHVLQIDKNITTQKSIVPKNAGFHNSTCRLLCSMVKSIHALTYSTIDYMCYGAQDFARILERKSQRIFPKLK